MTENGKLIIVLAILVLFQAVNLLVGYQLLSKNPTPVVVTKEVMVTPSPVLSATPSALPKKIK